ncbi:MAG: hypothetical protein LKF52_01035 [Butyrivibrio sp.]|jgi:hypothetical protein|nr:hypothetical protein [Butyrivibrio sp.]
MKDQKKYPGVYQTALSDGTASYRSSITFHQKHIALGSFPTASAAHRAYLYAGRVLQHPEWNLHRWKKNDALAFDKCVILFNFRDKGIYLPTPVYLEKRYFLYYLSPKTVLKFDIDDLFYYTSHKIMQRGSHLFVADYGSQINIMNRYGIQSYAVAGRDYHFANGDPTDLRYENIIILNRYRGVRQFADHGFMRYKAVIHVKGDFVIGAYDSEQEAAVAYNKAADILKRNGSPRAYAQNYLERLSASAYADIYTKVSISPKIYTLKFHEKDPS